MSDLEVQIALTRINARIANALIEAHGMTAENSYRIHNGTAVAYVDYDFTNTIERNRIDQNSIDLEINEARNK